MMREDTNGYQEKPTICSEQTAKLILHCDSFSGEMPIIRVLSPCPVLVERDGRLVQIVGYDKRSGIMAAGSKVPKVPLDHARELLNQLLDDFRFAAPSDGSRAIAALITPALVIGGILGGRSPVDLGEADASQAGKGFRNKLTAAIYRNRIVTVTQKKGGVGSLEESFNSALVAAFFVGLFGSVFLITSMTVLQIRVPDVLRGRVMGIHTVSFYLMSLGGLFGGVLASAYSPGAAVLTGAGVILAVTLAVVLTQREIRQIDGRRLTAELRTGEKPVAGVEPS